ncbi:ribonuclease III [Acetobacteraceae bacterium]|nr:ribonuclease III [Acetobacteraceae bacterium]
MPFSQLEKALGYSFRSQDLLRHALRHRSALMDLRGARRKKIEKKTASNERLEFLGDRVLSLAMATWLFETFPSESEGNLALRHNALVSGDTVAEVAKEIELEKSLEIGLKEKNVRNIASVRADAMEAILGSIYLDSGFLEANAVIRRLWKNRIHAYKEPPKEWKGRLQEYLLGKGKPLPVYTIVERKGTDHAPEFRIKVEGASLSAEGIGGSRREAEREAAANLFHLLIEGNAK